MQVTSNSPCRISSADFVYRLRDIGEIKVEARIYGEVEEGVLVVTL